MGNNRELGAGGGFGELDMQGLVKGRFGSRVL
jgi:hypothetical protein